MMKKFVVALSLFGVLVAAGCSSQDLTVYKNGEVAAEVVTGEETALNIYDSSRDVLEDSKELAESFGMEIPKNYVEVIEYAVDSKEIMEIEAGNKLLTVIPAPESESVTIYVE